DYPAEYGRKLGGVIEVTTKADVRPGLHGKAVAGGGSFGSGNGYVSGQYGWGRNTAALSVEGAHTDRYLDPPVEENFTNRSSHAGISARWERDLSAKDRLQLSVRRGTTRFLVPNELVQQSAGQRQDRNSEENSGQIAWTRVVSPRLLASIRAMVQDVSANLWSNPQSTPIQPSQQRGFRQGYANGSLSWHRGANEWKVGADALFASIDEAFAYRITNRRLFDRDTPRNFRFSGSAQDREQSAYIQDLYRLGNWTVSAGLRWDHYRLLVHDNAVSPRFGIAWYWPAAGIVFRASYDRAYQTPAIENLLLASSPAVAQLNDNALRLPVPPSRANFYQAGLAKAFWGKVRLEANYFRRNFHDFSDDDVLLNTGVSFPIAFAGAEITGTEAKLEVPSWGRFSGFLSYSNMTGFGRLPVTGGLFLGDESANLLRSNARFPITQDQRNSARARVRYSLGPRVWMAAQASYGSGLPVVENAGSNQLSGAYGPRILERVNFERGRVRPSFALDLSGGCELWKREKRSVRLQADLLNLTNRLNVVNFAGLFSGTALAAPRSGSLRLQAEF
ncbi:MAG: TonB-dependent receptor, partial [Acidobacteriota bacterium]|nr:TonB-dependent receptor [Acidobacteriota bacterium]